MAIVPGELKFPELPGDGVGDIEGVPILLVEEEKKSERKVGRTKEKQQRD